MCMFLKGCNETLMYVTLDVMLNSPFFFMSKLLDNMQCLVTIVYQKSLGMFSHALRSSQEC